MRACLNPKWFCCFRFSVFIFALVAASCNSSHNASANVSRHPKGVFLPGGDPKRCPDRCLSSGIAFARAVLCLDPTEENGKFLTDADKLLGKLKAESESAGGAIESVPLEWLLDELPVGPAEPALIVDDHGHLHLLLGKIDVDGQFFYQVVHGGSPLMLIAKSEILNAGFRSAWQVKHGNKGIPIHVGESIVRLDKIYHNFGEIKPNSKLQCTFQITNTGPVPVELGKPITPCTCTSTLLTESTKLQPGTTLPLGVSLQSRNTGGFQHLVLLRFREKELSLPRQVALSLFGSQRQLKRISTDMLNFGIVIPGQSYSRTVLIEEVATDRFSLKGFDPGNYPLTYKVEEKIGSEGYRLYRVTFELKPDDAFVGKHAGQVTLMTDSRFAPNVPIGVAFDVPPLLSVRPSILAFGDVCIGKPVERCVQFEPRNPGHVAVEIDPPPPGIKVRIGESFTGRTEMYVTLTLSKTDIWKGTIKGKAKIGERTLPIEIPCVAIGIKP